MALIFVLFLSSNHRPRHRRVVTIIVSRWWYNYRQRASGKSLARRPSPPSYPAERPQSAKVICALLYSNLAVGFPIFWNSLIRKLTFTSVFIYGICVYDTQWIKTVWVLKFKMKIISEFVKCSLRLYAQVKYSNPKKIYSWNSILENNIN